MDVAAGEFDASGRGLELPGNGAPIHRAHSALTDPRSSRQRHDRPRYGMRREAAGVARGMSTRRR